MGEVVRPQVPEWMKPAEGRSWYRVERNTAEDKADVYIYDAIGMWGTSASDFAKEMRDISESAINLHINSPGGDVFDGIAMYNAIASHPATVTAYVDGLAASAASFITQGANKVVMQPHARMMIHDAHVFKMDFGAYNAADLQKAIDDDTALLERLNASSDNIASIYSERAGGSTTEWRDRMKEETWFTDQEAVDVGLADEIGRPSGGRDAEKEAAKFDLAAVYEHVPERLVALHREMNSGDPHPPAPSPSSRGEGELTDEERAWVRAQMEKEEAGGGDAPENSGDRPLSDEERRALVDRWLAEGPR